MKEQQNILFLWVNFSDRRNNPVFIYPDCLHWIFSIIKKKSLITRIIKPGLQSKVPVSIFPTSVFWAQFLGMLSLSKSDFPHCMCDVWPLSIAGCSVVLSPLFWPLSFWPGLGRWALGKWIEGCPFTLYWCGTIFLSDIILENFVWHNIFSFLSSHNLNINPLGF